ncbi:MAG: NlpC/P60 family protein [Actinomycetota bacterium]
MPARPVTRAAWVAAAALLVAAASPGAAIPTRDDAYRAAVRGASSTRILADSFPGGTVTRAGAARLRVLVGDLTPRVIVVGQTPLRVTDEGAGAPPRTLPAGRRFQVTRAGGGYDLLDLDDPAAAAARLTGPVLVDSGAAPTGVRMAEPVDRRYRGALRILPSDGATMRIVNVVAVEAYVKGVLPGTMPPGWGRRASQALEAGAIAIRSSAMARLGRSAGDEWDEIVDDPLYLGLDGERAATNRAADRSRRLVYGTSRRPLEIGFPGVAPLGFVPDPGRPEVVADAPARPIPGARPGVGAAALDLAMTQIGVPYEWGGESPGGFDCSGLVYWAYAKVGIALPRVAEDQAAVGYPVRRGELLPGDAVFFADSSGYIHHMGLYIGAGRFVHAPQSGDTVRVQSMTSGYYARQYAGARRYSP